MNKTLLLAALFFCPRSFAQCPFTVNLTSSGNCSSSFLTVQTANSPAKITWNRDGIPITTVAVNSTPVIATVAGGSGPGPANNQVAKSAGIYVDASGNVYVVDALNNRVQKWAPGATSGIVVAGGNGQGSAANQLGNPTGIDIDGAGNIYIADNNSRVQKWAPGATSGITVAGGNGQGPAANQLDNPQGGIKVDKNGNVYIADYSNQRIQKWAPGAASGVTVAGGNGRGAAANQFSEPSGLCFDAAGNMYVADASNNRIQKWAPGATSGVTVAGGNGGGAAANQLYSPADVWVDPVGNMYISDWANSRVQLWTPGSTSGITVAGGKGYGSNPNQFSFPYFIFVDSRSDIYVSDTWNARVQEWSAVSNINTSYTATIPGTYTATVTDGASCIVTSNPQVLDAPLTPAVSINAKATSVCSGSPVTFNATAVNGGSAPVFQWQENGVNKGTNSSTYVDANPLNGSVISCIMTSNATCTTTPTGLAEPITLTVTQSVDPGVTISTPATTICSGKSVDFTAIPVNSGDNPIFQWQVNGNVTGSNSPSYTSSALSNGDIVICKITSNAACAVGSQATSNPVAITVNTPPYIDPGQEFSISQGQTISLDPVIVGDDLTYSWTPSTGLSDPSIRNPIASPIATTIYTLELFSAGGCEASGSITVKVSNPLSTQFRIPSAFTPNGDGKNDIFYVLAGPVGSVIKGFTIFNREGQKMFQAQNITPGDPGYGWNGYYQGVPALPGGYIYVIGVKLSNGTSQIIKGTVLLVK